MSNSFTDSTGETFHMEDGIWDEKPTIILKSDDQRGIGFFKSDATKIIALIAEAAA